MRQEIFRMERVTYKEKEVMLLENFNMQIYSGEIMGMIPINAHGLSAFLELLQNNLPLYDGYIYYGSETINSWKGSKKTLNRISIIEAKSRLVENMSVSDNIFVLRQGFRQEIIRTNLLRRQLAPFLQDIGMDIPLDVQVKDLSVFERVIVELLRAVVMGHRLIVLNEIGTLISYEEVQKLHDILRHYAQQGFSFLYICPHFEEIALVCDRAAMFSNGCICKIIRAGEMADETLRIYPAEYDGLVRNRIKSREEKDTFSEEILRVEHLCCNRIRDLSFKIYRAECVAVQVMENDIFHEIIQIMKGDSKADSGSVFLYGEKVDFTEEARIAVVQEQPTKSMIFPDLNYMENLCISLARRMPSIWMSRKLRGSIRREYGEIFGEEVFYMPVEKLSEKQKYRLVYTRILLQKPGVVFCIQPFKGADLEHRMFIWEMLNMLLCKGISVVILTLNLSDSLALADRLLIIDKEGSSREVMRKDFALIPAAAPWLHIYREQ